MSQLEVLVASRQRAFSLLERLASLDAQATSERGWRVVVPVVGVGTVPEALHRIRQWLTDVDLASVNVCLDGDAHLVRADRAAAPRGRAALDGA